MHENLIQLAIKKDEEDEQNISCAICYGIMVFGIYTSITYWLKYPDHRFEIQAPGWVCDTCGQKFFLEETGDLIDEAIDQVMRNQPLQITPGENWTELTNAEPSIHTRVSQAEP